MSTVSDNLARVQERIAAAAERAGRSAAEVTLVGVCKYVDARTAAELLAAGCRNLGESRPQQLWQKADDPALADQQVCWHLVGHLQRNKVARTVGLASLIHSVDSVRLLNAIDRAAAERHLRQAVLLEVNCSGEAAKHGFTAAEVQQLAPQLEQFAAVDVRGLMTMAARDEGPSTAAANFAALRQLRDGLADAATLPELSMGMSGDFEVAIAEGATIVRVGSTLWEGVERAAID